MSVQAGESYRFEQEILFDGHTYGANLSFPNGGQIEIQRGTDGYYWDGTAYVLAQTWNATMVDAGGLYHTYDWSVPGDAANGDTYNLRIRITGDADSESVGMMTVRPASGGGGDVVIRRPIIIFDD